jgi:hypothetical protein
MDDLAKDNQCLRYSMVAAAAFSFIRSGYNQYPFTGFYLYFAGCGYFH